VGLDSSPLHGDLLGLEQLEDRARSLAARFTLARERRRGTRDPLPTLPEHAKALRHAYRTLAGDVRRGEAFVPAGEWLLDNFHLIEGQLREVRHDLPARYYAELPKLATRELAGRARVHAMAIELRAAATRGSTCSG
jgi:cyclic beta-1,2-glucan synthetase